MARYPDEIVQQLKSHADISVILQRFIPLRRRGASWVGLCPFHDDHSPSFHVTPKMGIYKCFACGAGGDVFKFVMEHERMDFNAAVEMVASETGFALPSLSKEDQGVLEERSSQLALNELADQWFADQLIKSTLAKDYLDKRGIHENTRRQFHIGWAPDGRDGFLGYATSRGFSPPQIVAAGLANERESGGVVDKFRGRLMFAIQNLSGKPVAFGGRIIQDIPNAPKYMNSPETALYSKGQILYGLNHARESISKANEAILVEGYFDLISLHQAGITNVVAASGTALTEHHARILARYAKKLYLVFDGDAAGRKAAKRSLEVVLPVGMEIRVLILPEEDDPDELVREKGPEAFRNYIASQSRDILDFMAHESPRNTPEEKAAFLHEVRRLLAFIRDPILRQEYLDLATRRFEVARRMLHAPAQVPKNNRYSTPAAQGPITQAFNPVPPLEARFLNLMLQTPNLWNALHPWFDADLFESRPVAEILDHGLAMVEGAGTFNLALLTQELGEPEKEIIVRLKEESWNAANAAKEFLASLIQLNIQKLQRLRKDLQQVQPETDAKESELNQARISLAQLIKELNSIKSKVAMVESMQELFSSWNTTHGQLRHFLVKTSQIL